ncbi:MAG: SET domain-containing protein [Glaciecola sp.]|jgi:SET domain-containing protein
MIFEPENLSHVRELTLDNINDTQINKSELHGFGLFATQSIKQDCILCLLDGQVIDKQVYDHICEALLPSVKGVESYLFMECNYLNDHEILARTFRTKYSYINHSSMPNVSVKYHPIRIVANQHIAQGTELTIDYRQEPLTKSYLAKPEKQFLQGK